MTSPLLPSLSEDSSPDASLSRLDKFSFLFDSAEASSDNESEQKSKTSSRMTIENSSTASNEEGETEWLSSAALCAMSASVPVKQLIPPSSFDPHETQHRTGQTPNSVRAMTQRSDYPARFNNSEDAVGIHAHTTESPCKSPARMPIGLGVPIPSPPDMSLSTIFGAQESIDSRLPVHGVIGMPHTTEYAEYESAQLSFGTYSANATPRERVEFDQHSSLQEAMDIQRVNSATSPQLSEFPVPWYVAQLSPSGIPAEMCHSAPFYTGSFERHLNQHYDREGKGKSGGSMRVVPGMSPICLGASRSLEDLQPERIDSAGRLSWSEASHSPFRGRSFLVILDFAYLNDSELQHICERFGTLRAYHCDGYQAVVSYFDLRHAVSAESALRRAYPMLVISFLNLSEELKSLRRLLNISEVNQGTLVVFNLDSTIQVDQVAHLFARYGSVLEIRETANKKHHRFVEYYDVRDADRAIGALNRAEVCGKRLKVEISRNGASKQPLSPTQSLSNSSPVLKPRSMSHMSHEFSPPSTLLKKKASDPGKTLGAHVEMRHYGSGELEHYSPQNPQAKNLHDAQDHGKTYSGAFDETFGNRDALRVSVPSESSVLSALSPPQQSFEPLAAVNSSAKRTDSDRRNDIGAQRTSTGGPTRTNGNTRFVLNITKVLNGEDRRTSLMIRNIPNKYTQRMLLTTLEEQHRGQFDFFYLPIDFKNRCNVGYAFINFIRALDVVPFYENFHARKWGKFNSEKICEIAYARIQGKAALVSHFQNSSLMNEDPNCRPVLFNVHGQQEEFPVGTHVRTRRGPCVREQKVNDGA
eukprot:CAMPEP_0182444720 /NCGR_PEP_ID=MMETSP1172-20130603/3092_1 /TAXON_ID=708627 /ORGANISM="Timspurckia oligopyrenoides, Strain CCMP3278" /LENGTH=811 /DNA_ID=CAMNT_0024640349 /DNA_START=403 /DNA_END=2838 /DNA_ORIENTATION=-